MHTDHWKEEEVEYNRNNSIFIFGIGVAALVATCHADNWNLVIVRRWKQEAETDSDSAGYKTNTKKNYDQKM